MFLRKFILLFFLMALPFGLTKAQSISFTYQGYIELNGSPVNDTCEFTFSLYDALTSGNPIGAPQTVSGVVVTEGVFSVELDFGASAFNGSDRWLEIAVDCGDGLTPLSPLQPITPAVYASAAGGVDWSNIGNLPAGFADGTDHDTTYTPGTGLTLTGNEFSVTPNAFWSTGGNAGINPATQFIGTIGHVPLVFKVNGQTVLRLVPAGDSFNPNPNIIGGHAANVVGPNTFLHGVTIAGGGSAASPNQVSDIFGTVGGGLGNRVGVGDIFYSNEPAATVSGGQNNHALGAHTTIGGGQNNTTGGTHSAIGGGFNNRIDQSYSVISGGSYNHITSSYGVIGGGGSDTSTIGNRVTDNWGTVGGGTNNQAGDNLGDITDAPYATVGGGRNNTASGWESIVGGGYQNSANALQSAVFGGSDNKANAQWSFVGGGTANSTDAFASTITGGNTNTITATGGYGVIGGGHNNNVNNTYATIAGGYFNGVNGTYGTVGGGHNNIANGDYAAVSGGYNNNADGDYSFAAGREAKANHSGAFVWADSIGGPFSSWSPDTFNARSTGGFYFTPAVGVTCSLTDATGWFCSSTSDRNAKEAFMDVDSREVLEAVANMPITTWEYSGTDTRHIGPVAQDFYEAFGVGANETTISTVDADGVALAAIQGLNLKVDELQAEMSRKDLLLLMLTVGFGVVLLWRKRG